MQNLSLAEKRIAGIELTIGLQLFLDVLHFHLSRIFIIFKLILQFHI